MSQSSLQSISPLQQRLRKVGALIGGTPLYPIENLDVKKGVKIFAKLEWHQLGGSVKARPAYAIIREAVNSGILDGSKQLLDATSGNTGIAYAAIAASIGLKITICLPENASEERKRILRSLGVEIIYTSRFEGTDGAQQKAKQLAQKYPERFFYADQYANNANWKAHFYTTAKEIWEQTRGGVTHFVAGLGTTGTFTGTGRGLKSLNPQIRLVSLQPNNPMHGLEGWKHLETARVPKIFDPFLADEHIEVDTLEAYHYLKLLAEKEGLLVSPSAAANLAGAMKVAREIEQGIIVTTFADSADKYEEVLKMIFS